MIESAFRLLELERPRSSASDPPRLAPSRHALEIGQELRGDTWRWLLHADLLEVLLKYEIPSHGSLAFSARLSGVSKGVFIHEVEGPSGQHWEDSTIPARLFDRFAGGWFTIEACGLTGIKTSSQLGDLDPRLAAWVKDGDGSPRGALVIDGNLTMAFFLVLAEGTVIRCATVLSSANQVDSSRQPGAAQFADQRVGIVGCGSVGSKMAMTLARMGVRKFVLVDHDVFLPENIARHAADWRNVAQHKTDAVKQLVETIVGVAEVETSEIYITGQESNAVVDNVLARLSQCDVLVDATADSRTFNLIAGLSNRATIPMVWMQVYAGGIGGLVGRSRPGLDPDPHSMRATYDAFCAANYPPDWLVAARDYGSEGQEGAVVVASDSDVSIIAHHAARFVTDTLSTEQSAFPYSLYLIGLREGWVFQAPFATIPIEITDELPAAVADPLDVAAGAKFLVELLEKSNDPPSAG